MKFNALRARIAWPALDNDCNKDSMIVVDFAAGFFVAFSFYFVYFCQKKNLVALPPLSSSRFDRASTVGCVVAGGGSASTAAR